MGGNTTGSSAKNKKGNATQLIATLRHETDPKVAFNTIQQRVSRARSELGERADHQRMLDLAEALSEWAAQIGDDALGAGALVHAAELAQEAGDTEYMLEYFERALRRDPANPTPMARLQQALTEAGDYERLETARMTYVEALAERAAWEYELRVKALCALGELRAAHLNDLDTAIHAYQEAVEIEPLESAMERLAELFLQRDKAGDRDEAAELFFKLGEHRPPAEARPYLERALDCRPDHEGALAGLQQVAEVSPTDTQDAKLLSRMRDFATIAAASDRRDSVVAQLRVRDPEAVRELGELAQQLNDDAASTQDDAAHGSPRPLALSTGTRRSGAGTRAAGPGWLARLRRTESSRSAWLGAAALAALALLAMVAIGRHDNLSLRRAAPSVTAKAPRPAARPTPEPAARKPQAQKAGNRAKARHAARKHRAATIAPAPPQGVTLVPSLVRMRGQDDRAAMMRALAPVRRRLERCYAQARKRAPRLQGVVEYGFSVRPNGQPVRVRALGGSLGAPHVRECGVKALRAQRYPEPKRRTAAVRAVFAFAPSDEGR